MSLYDFPSYYDIVFDEDSREEADFLEGVWDRFGRGKLERLLEPACGTGRLIAELARRGYRLTGFDLNEAMLDYARNRLREERLAALIKPDAMESFAVRGRFQLAFCLISSFKYLLSERDALSHLECVARHLRPGGLYALGFHLTHYERRRPVSERWVAEREGVRVVCRTTTWPADRRRRRERIDNRLSIHFPSGEIRRHESVWEFRTYSAAQCQALLRKVPLFELVACYDFSYDLDLTRELDDSQEDIVLILKLRSK